MNTRENKIKVNLTENDCNNLGYPGFLLQDTRRYKNLYLPLSCKTGTLAHGS